jgi:ribonuclease-3
MTNGRTEETKDPLEDADAPRSLEDRSSDVFVMSAVSPAEDASSGVPQLRLLRRPPGGRDGIEALGLDELGFPEQPTGVYELALTHRSFAFEQPEPIEHNERLELLGDSVLGVIVTELIYKAYSDLSEGEMARLRAAVVNTIALADLARRLDIGQSIRLGKGEEATGGRDKSSLLADTFEAIIGAIYLDRGLQETAARLVPLFERELAAVVEAGDRYDAKNALQELAVRDGGDLPSYRVASSGPDHDKRFTAHVYLEGELYGAGMGRSKKEAEQNAAREALVRIEGNHARVS